MNIIYKFFHLVGRLLALIVDLPRLLIEALKVPFRFLFGSKQEDVPNE